MGRLQGIWIKRVQRGPMDAAEAAELVAGRGLRGDATQGGRRQVTILSLRGRLLRIGDARVRIFGETRPCHQMDEACPGLQAALSPPWGGGVFGEVIESGSIAVGAPVAWEDGAPAGAEPPARARTTPSPATP